MNRGETEEPADRQAALLAAPLGAMLSSPHRPMFIAAGLWAVIVVAVTTWFGRIDMTDSPLRDVASWHGHEMIFGFAAAGFAGYTLTAMTSWTGRESMSRRGTMVLLALWVLARLAAAGALGDDPRLVVPAGVAFLAFVTATLIRAALRAGSKRGTVQALFAGLLTGLQIAVLSGENMPRIPVLGFVLLLSVIGGRMVAAFTWNQIDRSPAQARRFALARLAGAPAAAAISLVLALEGLGLGDGWLPISLLLIAAAAEALRLLLWQSRQSVQVGLLVMLHLGYFWLPFGLVLVALARLPGTALSESDALHALAAGAVACSIYAVAARAVARRADRLRPAIVDIVGFVLLWAAAAFRVFGQTDPALDGVAPVVWCAAWALFLVRHCAALVAPLPRPVFSGPKHSNGHTIG